MLETSKDLFWIVLSFCILWFTIFICWGIYYIIMVFKNINDLVREMKEKIITVENFFISLKTKIEKSASNITSLVNLSKQLITYFKDRTEKGMAGKTKKSKK